MVSGKALLPSAIRAGPAIVREVKHGTAFNFHSIFNTKQINTQKPTAYITIIDLEVVVNRVGFLPEETYFI